MTAQSMPMPNPLFVWAVRVLFTWNWSSDKTLPQRTGANPESWQRNWVVSKAILVMLFQAGMWITAVGILIVRPYYLGYIGRGGLYLSLVTILSATFLAWCVHELWFYTRRYSDDHSSAGHTKFLHYWPDWVRYVMPSMYDSNMPRICAVAFMIVVGGIWWVQSFAQDWDLQYLTRTEQVCTVTGITPKYAKGWGFSLQTSLMCADSRRFLVEDPDIMSLVWNNREPLQCYTYEHGLLSCFRK